MLNPPEESLVATLAPRHADRADVADVADVTDANSNPDAWLSVLPEHAALVASAPLPVEPYGAAVLPASQYLFDQELLGFEAQLRSLAQLLAGFGRVLNLAPMPEIFATPRSLAALSPGAGVAGDPPVVHLRLGPVRCARVMKGASNIAVLADDVVRPPVDTSAPLGSDSHLPAPFQAVLTAAATRRSGPLRHAHRGFGAALPMHTLPDAFSCADLAIQAHPGWLAAPDPAADWQLLCALRVRSLAEYQTADWLRPAAACEALDAPDWRRARALGRRDMSAAPPARFVLLPWNLSNPASIVPDLVGKLLGWDHGEHPPFRVVLYPFNATPTSRGAIAELAAGAALLPGSAAARRGVFVAKLHTARAAAALRRLFPIAWIEADDPESDWTARRLGQLGLGLVALGKAGFAQVCAVAPDETVKITCVDHFGARTYAARTLSARRLVSLLARSQDAIAAAAPAAPTLTPAWGSQWAN
jgi:hypothetical protein